MSVKFRYILGVVGIFVVVSGWWVFHFPFTPELVWRVIPADATAASRHIAPALRINELCEVSAITNIVSMIGAEDLLDDYGTRKLIDIIGDKYVVSAYVPSMGGYGQPGVVFGAWVGGYSQLLRWGLLDRLLSDFSVHPLAGNRRVWVLECPEIYEGCFLSLAVHEGVLAGCFSAEEFGVLHITSRLMGQKSVAAIAAEWCDSETGHADEFRAKIELPKKVGKGEVDLFGSLSDLSEKGLKAEIEFSPDSDALAVWKQYFPIEDIKIKNGGMDLLGDSIGLLCAIPISSIAPFLELSKVDEHNVWHKLEKIFRKDAQASLFACGDKYYGHIMRMKVPSLGFVIPLADGVGGSDAVRRLVDELNATWGLGLITTADSNDNRIKIINSVRGGGYKKLRPNERLAIAVCDGWMIGLSNVDVLRRILGDSTGVSNAGKSLVESHAIVYGWSDLAETGELLKTAIYGYTLVSLLQKNRGAVRHDTGDLMMAVRALGALGQCSVWLRSDIDKPKLFGEITF